MKCKLLNHVDMLKMLNIIVDMYIIYIYILCSTYISHCEF